MMSTKVLHAHRWAALPERGTPASLRLIAWIALHVGRWAARLLLYPITLYFVVSGHAARRSEAGVPRSGKAAQRCACKTLVDIICIGRPYFGRRSRRRKNADRSREYDRHPAQL